MKYMEQRQANRDDLDNEVAEVRATFEAAVKAGGAAAIAHAAIDVINIIGDSEIETPIINIARRHLAAAMDQIYGPLPT